MLPTVRDRPALRRHEGLLVASAYHRQTAMSTWARSALDRGEKLLTLCAPVDADIASRAGSGLTALTRDDLHATAAPAELLQRALSEGDHGLGILIWADAVITATSRETHEEIETTLTSLCHDHPASVLCVYDRIADRDGAGSRPPRPSRRPPPQRAPRTTPHAAPPRAHPLRLRRARHVQPRRLRHRAARSHRHPITHRAHRPGGRDVPRRRRSPHPHPRHRPLPRPRMRGRDPRHPPHHPHPPTDRHPPTSPTSPQLSRGARRHG